VLAGGKGLLPEKVGERVGGQRCVLFFFLHEIGVGIGPLKGLRGIPREREIPVGVGE